MTKHKHLTFEDRMNIEAMLNDKASLSRIAEFLSKDPSTISKEIRRHLVFRRVGGMRTSYNACIKRFTCSKSHICNPCHANRRYSLCRRCSMCNRFCDEFQPEICKRLTKPPYVCNGCSTRYKCTLEKRFYKAADAHAEYRSILSETRTGISFSEEELEAAEYPRQTLLSIPRFFTREAGHDD